MVAWFTLVLEANCIYKTTSFLVVSSSFPLPGIRQEEETTTKLSLAVRPCNQGNHSVFKTVFTVMKSQST